MKALKVLFMALALVAANYACSDKDDEPTQEIPGTPDTPDTPDQPDEPDTPDTPDTPDEPDTPPTPVISLSQSDLIFKAEGETINIGYEVDEAYRGNHYALAACQLVLQVARYHDTSKIYLTCNYDNMASSKTIEKLG